MALLGSLATLVALALCSGAAAEDTKVCEEGSEPGQCLEPEGVAADRGIPPETGAQQIYVAERGTDRISVFDPEGNFLFAFGELGSEAGQLNNPRGIAVDNVEGSTARHRLYVYDASNRRLVAYDHEGTFLWMAGKEVNTGTSGNANLCTNAGPPTDVCKAGAAGSGPGEFTSTENPVSVGPEGIVYVSDMPKFAEEPRIQKFDHEGTYIAECEPAHEDRLNGGLAVDSAGDLYAAFNLGGGIYKFEWAEPVCPEAGAPYPIDAAVGTRALAVDDEDNLYAGQNESKANPSGSYRIVTAYDSAGAHLARFGYGAFANLITGVAPLATAFGDVVGSERGSAGDAVDYLTLPGPLGETGPVVAPPSVLAPEEEVTTARARLEAEINPEGKATEYRFDYLDRASYEAEGFESPSTKSTPTEELDGGASDFSLRYVEATVGCEDPLNEAEASKCLLADTEYVFRALAVNADNPEGEGQAQALGEFATREAPEFLATYATEPSSDTMRFNVRLDPLGIGPTAGYFEYVEEAAYQADIEEGGDGFAEATQVPDVEGGESPLDFGSGEGPVTRGATVFPLPPGTAYRYRALAESPLTLEPVIGAERSFRTFAVGEVEAGCANAALRQGPGAQLPDCRAYELVSPLEKAGGDVITLKDPTRHVPIGLGQAADSGERLTYSSYRPFADPEGAPNISQYLAERQPGSGWSNRSISPPRERPIMHPADLVRSEYKAADSELCSFWLRTVYEPTLAEDAIERYPNLYRRDVEGPGCPEPSYTALTTNEPSHETKVNPPFPGEHFNSLELQGVSGDGKAAIYAVTDALAGTEAPDSEGEDLALYEWEEGAPLRYACILPEAEGPFGAGCSGGMLAGGPGIGLEDRLTGAISTDGSRVYWTAAGNLGTGPGPIYVRIGGTETLAVSASAEAEEAVSESEFEAAAADGSRALFETNGTLYEYSLEAEEASAVMPQYLGMLGASEDLSRAYVVSEAALEEEAEAGKPNLYLHEAGEEPRFIATLADADRPTAFTPSPFDPDPYRHIARVSPDGRHAAFNSFAQLTGYDNTDAVSGEADTEVFHYDAEAAEGEGELVCVSCNPSGARPAGEDVAAVFGAIGGVNEFWAGAYLPAAESSLHFPRALTDDGSRVYFHSSDALVARDSNGAQDLYQWELEGAGGCDAEDPNFSEAAGGCVELVSSGTSSYESVLVDASPTGDDVFFTTLASLAGGDYGLVDVYDARVGGGFAEAPPPPPECEAEACQNPAPAPEAIPPASSTYVGPGNLAPPKQNKKARRCPKGKRKVKRKGKVRCVTKKQRRARARHNRVHPAQRAR